jgi:hypothetical protein
MTLAKARIVNYDHNCSFIVLATGITIVNYDYHLFIVQAIGLQLTTRGVIYDRNMFKVQAIAVDVKKNQEFDMCPPSFSFIDSSSRCYNLKKLFESQTKTGCYSNFNFV